MPFCRACNQEIMFIKLTSGKHNPVNLEPVRVHAGSNEGVFVFEYGEVKHSKSLDVDEWGYVSHFATCPLAKKFRK